LEICHLKGLSGSEVLRDSIEKVVNYEMGVDELV
jgi:hypothetical protein